VKDLKRKQYQIKHVPYHVNLEVMN